MRWWDSHANRLSRETALSSEARELRVDIVNLIVQRSEQFEQRFDLFFQVSR
jgi:hypothetical protein